MEKLNQTLLFTAILRFKKWKFANFFIKYFKTQEEKLNFVTFSKSVDQPEMHKNLTYTFSLQRGVWLASLLAGSTPGST